MATLKSDILNLKSEIPLSWYFLWFYSHHCMGYRPIAEIGVHTCEDQYYRP